MYKCIKLKLLFLCLLLSLSIRAEWKSDGAAGRGSYGINCIVTSQLRLSISGKFIFKTTDAGKTWQKDSLDLTLDQLNKLNAQKISFVDESNGFIQCHLWDSIFLFKTVDGGKHWQRVLFNLDANELVFSTALHWFAYNSKKIYMTADGGQQWQDINTSSGDTTVFSVEVLNHKIFVFSGNKNNVANLYASDAIGNKWEKLGQLQLFNDSDFNVARVMLAGLAETQQGLVVLYNVYYSGCGSYYDHSKIFYLHKQIHNWEIGDSIKRFPYTPTGIIFKDNVGYISTQYSIFKSDDAGYNWFPVFVQKDFRDGAIEGIVFTDGAFMAYTFSSNVYLNIDPNADKNLSSPNSSHHGNSISVYPNPAVDFVTLAFSEIDFSNATINIVDMSGKLIYQTNIYHQNKITIETANLSAGIYQYSISNQQNTINGKFIVQ